MHRTGENIFKGTEGRFEERYIKAKDGNEEVYGYGFGKSYSKSETKKSDETQNKRLKIRLEKTPPFGGSKN